MVLSPMRPATIVADNVGDDLEASGGSKFYSESFV